MGSRRFELASFSKSVASATFSSTLYGEKSGVRGEVRGERGEVRGERGEGRGRKKV